MVAEKGKRKKRRGREGSREERRVMRMHKENISSKPLIGKMKRAYFLEFLQPLGLKDWNFKEQQA